MSEDENRRPLKVREGTLPKRIASWLSRRRITPNQISVTSVLFALLAAACLLFLPFVDGAVKWVLPLLAGIWIQCRLLCNLFDGMVAIEGGKGTRSGELFNDIPDRVADPLILVAAGYATTVVPWASAIGWAAGLGAVMTAYVRTLAASIGAPVVFCGPMAKQHRMAIMTVACVAVSVEQKTFGSDWSLLVALIVILVGCIVTVGRRARLAYKALEAETHA
ncbi:MAG: CDP-alcohol phosphatidyltransferase family protein [Fuerstiella sp.]